jgi:DNA-binding CsgD family transcriptional regulator
MAPSAQGERGEQSGRSGPRRLTARESAVALLVARGYTNGEIARELGITPRTVAAHVEHILRKLEMRSRVQIASWVSAGATGETGATGDVGKAGAPNIGRPADAGGPARVYRGAGRRR